jgi:hypothetical protein
MVVLLYLYLRIMQSSSGWKPESTGKEEGMSRTAGWRGETCHRRRPLPRRRTDFGDVGSEAGRNTTMPMFSFRGDKRLASDSLVATRTHVSARHPRVAGFHHRKTSPAKIS